MDREPTVNPWFRVYNDILNDAKLLDLSLDNQAIFFKFLAVSNLHNSGGTLPKPEVISKMIGVRIDKVRSAIRSMVDVGLIDEDPATQQLAMHGWGRRQYKSDNANDRQKARRERNLSRDKSPESQRDKTVTRVRAADAETDTEAEKSPPTPQGGRHAPVTVVDSGDPDPTPPPVVDPPGSPGYRAVMDLIPDGWKLHAEPFAAGLLSRLPAVAVRYGLEETLERLEGGFGRQAKAYWRTVAEANPTGRPPRGESSRPRQAPAPPPPKFFRAGADEILSLPQPPQRPEEGRWRPRGGAVVGGAG